MLMLSSETQMAPGRMAFSSAHIKFVGIIKKIKIKVMQDGPVVHERKLCQSTSSKVVYALRVY